MMWEQGYLDGAQMGGSFQLLNARTMIWSSLARVAGGAFFCRTDCAPCHGGGVTPADAPGLYVLGN